MLQVWGPLLRMFQCHNLHILFLRFHSKKWNVSMGVLEIQCTYSRILTLSLWMFFMLERARSRREDCLWKLSEGVGVEGWVVLFVWGGM